jgi:putative endonuclease
MPFVYIVRCADGSLYTGWAVDVERRVKAHNAGRGAAYTRMHGPVELVYAEELPTRSEAQKRELAIKRYPRAKKLALCQPPPAPAKHRDAASRRKPAPRRAVKAGR